MEISVGHEGKRRKTCTAKWHAADCILIHLATPIPSHPKTEDANAPSINGFKTGQLDICASAPCQTWVWAMGSKNDTAETTLWRGSFQILAEGQCAIRGSSHLHKQRLSKFLTCQPSQHGIHDPKPLVTLGCAPSYRCL